MPYRIYEADHPAFCERKFLEMIVAGIFQSTIYTVIGSIGMMIVGFYFGHIGLSAVVVTGPIGFLCGFLITLLTSGCRIIYPEEIGHYERENANDYFSTALTAGALVTAVFMILMFTAGYKYFNLYSLSGETLELAKEYLVFNKYVYVLMPFSGFISQMVYSDGDIRLCTIGNFVYFVLDIVLSFIGGAFFGIRGIGLAALISVLISLLVFSTHFMKKDCELKFRPYYSLKKHMKIMHLSIMDSLYSLFSGMNGVILVSYITSCFGSEYLAVNSVVGQALGYTGLFGAATEAMTPILNLYRGEKNNDGVKKIIRVTIKWILMIGTAMTVLVFLLASFFPLIFSLSDPSLSKTCITGIRIVSLSFIFHGLVTFLTTYYNISGHVIIATVVARLRDSVLYIVCIVVFGYLFGVNGLWIGTMLTPVVTFALVTIAFRIFSNQTSILMLEPDDRKVQSYDFDLVPQTIVMVRDRIGQFLRENSVLSVTANQVELMIEETYMMIYEKNHSHKNETGKKLLGEATVFIGDNINLILRDNGVTYNIFDEGEKIVTLQDYVFTNLLLRIPQYHNSAALSFNRRQFTFQDSSLAKNSSEKKKEQHL